jgi:MurNAc alpha-1-phosphate uridylyltransferase
MIYYDFSPLSYVNLDRDITALILAAGFGSRLGNITRTIPKPLVELGGMTLLNRACLKLHEAGIRRIIINTHYLADLIFQHISFLQQQFHDTDFIIAHEPEILDTGGTLKRIAAETTLSEILVFNADALLWGTTQPLSPLIQQWRTMDAEALLYLKTIPHNTMGDFNVTTHPLGILDRSGKLQLQYVGVGMYNLTPLLNIPLTKFGIIKDHMLPQLATQRFYGMMMPGWHMDVGTPQNLELARQLTT